MHNRNVLKKAKTSIVVTFVAATLSSFSLSTIPFLERLEEEKGQIIAYIIAAVFWIGLLLTFISAYITTRILRKSREKLKSKGSIKMRQAIGIVSFSVDWRMWILYGTIILGLVLIITDIIIGYVPELIMFPVVSITILSFIVHCVIDGKYYKTYKLIKESVKQ